MTEVFVMVMMILILLVFANGVISWAAAFVAFCGNVLGRVEDEKCASVVFYAMVSTILMLFAMVSTILILPFGD